MAANESPQQVNIAGEPPPGQIGGNSFRNESCPWLRLAMTVSAPGWRAGEAGPSGGAQDSLELIAGRGPRGCPWIARRTAAIAFIVTGKGTGPVRGRGPEGRERQG